MATRQQGVSKPDRLKRKAVQTETPAQRYDATPHSVVVVFKNIITPMFPRRKNARRRISGEVADHASTSRAPGPDTEAEAKTRRTPDAPSTEDVDKISATNFEVASARNHRHRRTVLRDACFSLEALNAFNARDAHLRAARDGLTRATEI